MYTVDVSAPKSKSGKLDLPNTVPHSCFDVFTTWWPPARVLVDLQGAASENPSKRKAFRCLLVIGRSLTSCAANVRAGFTFEQRCIVTGTTLECSQSDFALFSPKRAGGFWS
jgi:hypothetical protein